MTYVFGLLAIICFLIMPIAFVWFIVTLIRKKKIKIPIIILGSSFMWFFAFIFLMLLTYPYETLETDSEETKEEERVIEAESQKSIVVDEAQDEPSNEDEESNNIVNKTKENDSSKEKESDDKSKKEKYESGKTTQDGVKPSNDVKNAKDKDKKEEIIYKDVFFQNLTEGWEDYVGEKIRTTFPCDNCYDDETITSLYDSGKYIKVFADNYREFEEDTYITVTGEVFGTQSSYIEIKNAHIEVYGDKSENEYNEAKAEYDEIKRIEAEKEEAEFKENAESPTYDDLVRYPDSNKGKAIKLDVKIVESRPEGIIFAGGYLAHMGGSSNEITIVDEREVKEPKLLEGDNVTIYGYGNGLSTIKIQDKSGILPKTVDKYEVPSIDLKYVELKQ